MPSHSLVADNAHKAPLFVDDSNLIEVVSEHQCSRLEQRCGLCDCNRGKVHQLLCWDSMHPSNVTVDLLPCDDFQHINSMDSTLRRTLVINDEHVVPIIRCQVIDDIGH